VLSTKPELATETRTSACPLCEGNGEVYAGVSYGYFDIHQEQWYPDEPRTCPRCNGRGNVEETACLVCKEPIEVCTCTDEEIEAYLLASYLGVA